MSTEIVTHDSVFAQTTGYIASCLAIFFFISPLILLKEAFSTNDLSKVPFLMLIVNTINCFLWTTYGFYSHQNPIWVCNLTGFLLNSAWLVCYFLILFQANPFLKKISSIACISSALFGFSFGVFLYMIEGEERLKFASIVNTFAYSAAMINVVMYLAPGQNLYKVYQTENYNLIPIVSSCFGWLSTIFWVIYSLSDKTAMQKGIDLPCFIPNSLGLVLMPIQIVMWYYYRSKAIKEGYYFDKENNKIKNEQSVPLTNYSEDN